MAREFDVAIELDAEGPMWSPCPCCRSAICSPALLTCS